MRATPALLHFLHLYFTFAGTIRVAPDTAPTPPGWFAAIVYCNATAVGGESRTWLGVKRMFAVMAQSASQPKLALAADASLHAPIKSLTY